MRVFNLGTSRPAWYDRGPTVKSAGYSQGGIAPHAATDRWTYTVPANRKTAAQCIQAAVTREGVAGAPGLQLTRIRYTQAGGSLIELIYAPVLANTTGAQSNLINSGTLVMLAGDLIVGNTYDNSTGGTGNYSCSIQALEYDA